MAKNHRGFTVVELLVVIVIIAILTAISIVVYSQVRVTGRDSDRSSKVKVIAESLENYYSKNGEYPGCTAMTQSGSSVSTNVLDGLNPSVLIAPKSASGVTNSIICAAITGSTTTDSFGYVGDGTATCNTGAACSQYTLQYKEEKTGNIISLTSKHQLDSASSGAPTISVTATTNTQINLSWTAIGGATSYKLQRAVNASFSSGLVETSGAPATASATGLTPGTSYFFRVAAMTGATQGAWSNTAQSITTISPPASAPTASAVISGTNAIGTSTAVTCSSGTTQYQLRSRSTATSTAGTWSSWSTWGTGLTLTVPASQGYQYGFQAQARCQGPNNSSAATAVSNTPTAVRSINTPAAPAYLSPSYFYSNVTAVVNYASYCPAGTNLYNDNFTTVAWTGGNWGPHPFGYNDSWQNTSSSTKYVTYTARYQCQTTYATSPVSPDSNDSIGVRP